MTKLLTLTIAFLLLVATVGVTTASARCDNCVIRNGKEYPLDPRRAQLREIKTRVDRSCPAGTRVERDTVVDGSLTAHRHRCVFRSAP